MRILRLAPPDDPARGSRAGFPRTARPQLLQSPRNALSARDAVSSFAEVTSTPSFSSSSPQQNDRLPGYLACSRGRPAQPACAGPSPRRTHWGRVHSPSCCRVLPRPGCFLWTPAHLDRRMNGCISSEIKHTVFSETKNWIKVLNGCLPTPTTEMAHLWLNSTPGVIFHKRFLWRTLGCSGPPVTRRVP